MSTTTTTSAPIEATDEPQESLIKRILSAQSVWILGVLVIISGILYVISGLLGILASSSSDLTSNQKTTLLVISIVILLIGIIEIAVARGLFRGSNGARLIVAVLNILTIVGALFYHLRFPPKDMAITLAALWLVAVMVLEWVTPKPLSPYFMTAAVAPAVLVGGWIHGAMTWRRIARASRRKKV